MRPTVIRTETGLDELQAAWNALAEKTSASYFSSFEYVHTAWRHFRKPTDQLLVLVLSDGPSVVGIAPFCVSRDQRSGVPCRVVRFIAMWEGDRPQILADGDERLVWKSVIDVLCDDERRAWEVLELREQPVAGPRGAGWGFLSRSGLLWEQRPDAVGYYIPLSGSWDDYLRGLSSNTRADWRRKARRLSEACGGYGLECLSDPLRMIEGLERFIALERSGWKPEAGVGLAKDETHRRFYSDIVGRLASRSGVEFYFLKCKGEDVAGLVNFVYRDVVYLRQTAYQPTYSRHSPGIILLGEVARQLFGDRFREYDLLGMREDQAPSRYKLQWAKGRRETVEWMAYRVRSRLLLWLMARGVYRTLRSLSRGWGSPKAPSARGLRPSHRGGAPRPPR